MDELAYAARLDPYEFRKRNISHPRWLGVLKAATDAAKWTPRVAASNALRRDRQRARHRARHAPPAVQPGRSRHLCGGRRGHRGEQGQRRRHRQARVWRDGLWPGHQSRDRRKPDRRHVGPRRQPGAERGSAVQPDQRDESRLELAIRRCASANIPPSRRLWSSSCTRSPVARARKCCRPWSPPSGTRSSTRRA